MFQSKSVKVFLCCVLLVAVTSRLCEGRAMLQLVSAGSGGSVAVSNRNSTLVGELTVAGVTDDGRENATVGVLDRIGRLRYGVLSSIDLDADNTTASTGVTSFARSSGGASVSVGTSARVFIAG